MSIWGIGHNLSGDTQKDISDLFIENSFICLGWSEKEKPQFYNLLNQIQKFDLIYLKKWSPRDDAIEIKAIGIVGDTNFQIPENEIIKNRIGIKVVWIKEFSACPLKFNPIDPDWRKNINRYDAIFKENHPEIQNYILDLLDINKKG